VSISQRLVIHAIDYSEKIVLTVVLGHMSQYHWSSLLELMVVDVVAV